MSQEKLGAGNQEGSHTHAGGEMPDDELSLKEAHEWEEEPSGQDMFGRPAKKSPPKIIDRGLAEEKDY